MNGFYTFRKATNLAKAFFFFFLVWVTWQQGVCEFCFLITYKYGQMDSQQVDRFNLDIRCLNRGFSFKQVCPEILTCYHPHPLLASFNQEIHLRKLAEKIISPSWGWAISFTPSARTGGGQADRPLWVLMPLYFLEVTGCLVEAHRQYVCMPTALVLGILVNHPSKFCRVKPPFVLSSLTAHCFSIPRKKAWVRLFDCTSLRAPWLCVCDEGYLDKVGYNFHWELQEMGDPGISPKEFWE